MGLIFVNQWVPWQIGFVTLVVLLPHLYLAKDAPVYKPGLATSIAGVCFSILCSLAYFFVCHRMNQVKQTDAYKQDFNAMPEREQINAGDRNQTLFTCIRQNYNLTVLT